MDHFLYRQGKLFCEDVPVRRLAEEYGTPLYVYSTATLLHHLGQLQNALADVAGQGGRVASAALRVNPDLPPKTHAKTDTSVKGVKFGLDIDTVLDVAQGVSDNPHVRVVGLHMHLG